MNTILIYLLAPSARVFEKLQNWIYYQAITIYTTTIQATIIYAITI